MEFQLDKEESSKGKPSKGGKGAGLRSWQGPGIQGSVGCGKVLGGPDAEARCAGLLGVPRPLQRGALPLLRACVCSASRDAVGLVRTWQYQDALWSCGHVLWGVVLSLHPDTYPSPSSEPSQPVAPIPSLLVPV